MVERPCGELKSDEVFYYADELNNRWHPAISVLWSPRSQQVMIPTPMQPKRRNGLGAANWHMGETIVLARPRKRWRREVAELLQVLVDKHPDEHVHVAWDNSGTHQGNGIEAVVRGCRVGRLVLLSLATFGP